MRRYRRSAGMPVRSCQYFRGYGNPYVCDIITRRIRGRMIIAAMSRRAAFAGCCGTLADVFNVRNPRAYRLTICPRYARRSEKACGSKARTFCEIYGSEAWRKKNLQLAGLRY